VLRGEHIVRRFSKSESFLGPCAGVAKEKKLAGSKAFCAKKIVTREGVTDSGE
jgi:hypothetical protein